MIWYKYINNITYIYIICVCIYNICVCVCAASRVPKPGQLGKSDLVWPVWQVWVGLGGSGPIFSQYTVPPSLASLASLRQFEVVCASRRQSGSFWPSEIFLISVLTPADFDNWIATERGLNQSPLLTLHQNPPTHKTQHCIELYMTARQQSIKLHW